MFSTTAWNIPGMEHWWRFQEDCSQSVEQQRRRSGYRRLNAGQLERPGDDMLQSEGLVD